jgi:hypothetical protein
VPSPLTNYHLDMLRGYVAQAAQGSMFGFTYPVPERVHELSERVAAQIRHANQRDGTSLQEAGIALITKRDVHLLTRLGQHLIETAGLPGRAKTPEANTRLSLAQSILDVRDALESALVVQGELPERRTGER